MICLIFCCDTSDIGSAAMLNRLDEKEIEIYQKQLRKEMDRRAKIKATQEETGDAGGPMNFNTDVGHDKKPGAEVIPPIGSQGSKATMV